MFEEFMGTKPVSERQKFDIAALTAYLRQHVAGYPGPAQQIALAALNDRVWQEHTRQRLHNSGARLQQLLAAHGIASSGTALFQWWPATQPEAFWQHMAERGIWVRLFSHAARGIRLGLPPDEAGWQRLALALHEWTNKDST